MFISLGKLHFFVSKIIQGTVRRVAGEENAFAVGVGHNCCGQC